MTWVLLLGLVGLVAAAWWIRRNPRGGGGVLSAVVVLILIVAVVGLVQRLGRRSEPLTLTFEEAAGEVLAGEVVSRLTSGDTVLLLRYPASKTGSREITYRRARAFERVAKQAGLTVRQGGGDPRSAGVNEDDYLLFDHTRLATEVTAWCAAHPEVKAVVSMLHQLPPDLPAVKSSPPWFGFDAGRSLVSDHMGRTGPLVAVVRYGAAPVQLKHSPRGADAQKLFEMRFELVPVP